MDIEITSVCDLKCRHCYNFWRNDDIPVPSTKMSIEQADSLIDQIIENKVFHIILTGGECLTNYTVLTHFMRRLGDAEISFSMNSNLRIANQEKMRFGDGHMFHANISNNRVCTVKRIRI